jgi:hypothetical protein
MPYVLIVRSQKRASLGTSRCLTVRRKMRIGARAYHAQLYLHSRLRRMALIDRFKYVSRKQIRWFGGVFLAIGTVSGPSLVTIASPNAAGVLARCAAVDRRRFASGPPRLSHDRERNPPPHLCHAGGGLEGNAPRDRDDMAPGEDPPERRFGVVKCFSLKGLIPLKGAGAANIE